MDTNNKPYIDHLLLQALRNDDEKALNHLFKNYYNILFRAGLKWSFDSHLTEECIQLVFQDLWQYRKTLGEIISFEAYLKGSLRKRLSRYGSKTIFENLENQVLSTVSFEEILIAQEENESQKQKLHKALNLLSPRQKEIIILKYFEELSYNEISVKTGLKVDSIYKTLHEGIKKLKGLIIV